MTEEQACAVEDLLLTPRPLVLALRPDYIAGDTLDDAARTIRG